MGCMADYDEDCKGKKPKGCLCQSCCQPRLRAYQVGLDEDESDECVIAENSREAKKIGWRDSDFLKDSAEYTEIRVKWLRNGDISGLKKGIQEDYGDLLKRGLFSCIFNSDCPTCKTTDTSVYRDDDGKIYCSRCEED